MAQHAVLKITKETAQLRDRAAELQSQLEFKTIDHDKLQTQISELLVGASNIHPALCCILSDTHS